MKKNVLYTEEAGVGVVTVQRPEVHNALNMATIRELRDLFVRLKGEERLRAMVLTGAGDKTFLSGGDLKEFQHLKTVEEARHMISTMKEATDLLAGFPWPVIAAVNGLAVGGGCETAVACDFRVASRAAKLGYRQIRMGLISGWGGGPRLVHLIGKGRALRMMTTGELLSAEEAMAIGLVDQVVEPDQVMPSALALARTIAENAPLAVRAYKRLVQMTVRVPLEAALEFETELFGPVWVSEDHEECVRAFFEKRKPNPAGR